MDTFSRNTDKIYIPSTLECIIWVVTSFLSCISLNFNPDIKAVFLDVTLIHIFFMVPSAFFLLHGLKTAQPNYTLPWLFFSLWNICTGQYFLLEEVAASAYLTYNVLPSKGCFVFFTTMLSLVFRIMLWGRTVYIAFFEVKLTEIPVPVEDRKISELEIRKTETKDIPIKYMKNLTSRYADEATKKPLK